MEQEKGESGEGEERSEKAWRGGESAKGDLRRHGDMGGDGKERYEKAWRYGGRWKREI